MKNVGKQLTHAFRAAKVQILVIAAALGMVFGYTCAFAQSGAGSIQGTVTDATGAVMPGSSIRVVNQATNVTINTKSNNVGFFQVPELFTGTYAVTVTTPGMKTYEQTIQLLVAQNAVINVRMTPGAITQQIQVSADLIQLTTTDNGITGSTLENARINQLPMNGRNLLTLTNEVTPGLTSCRQSPSCANGMMPAATAYEVDGVTLESREFGGANASQNALPDPDSIQEVSVETSGVGAQYATPAIGVMTTKSGTNQIHGTLFETARNSAFGLAKTRQDPSDFSAPHYVRNEFGVSAGGPIVIPHLYHGKDKSFWFFAYERFSLGQKSYELGKVPTMAMRSGDFSGLVTGAGITHQLYDPSTTQANTACPSPGVVNGVQVWNAGPPVNNQWCRTPFGNGIGGDPGNNQIPINRLSPLAKVVYAISPPPSTADNPLVTNNLNIPDPRFTVAPNITFRLDHAFNENNRAYLRYTSNITTNINLRNNPSNEPASIAATVDGVNFPADAVGLASSPSKLFAAAAGFTHVFSPTFFSETILSQQWLSEDNWAAGPAPHTDFEQLMGLPNNFNQNGFPEISSSLLSIGGTFYQYGITGIISSLDENLSKTVGKHQMQFGGRYRHERFGYLENQGYDNVAFNGQATALENPGSKANYTGDPNTGYSDADEYLGAASAYTVHYQPPYIHFHDMEFDTYFQDNYRVTRKLTLNLGLRYEAHPSAWMKDGTIDGFDMKNDALVLGATPESLIAKGFTTQPIINNILADGGKIETAQEAGQPSTLMNNYNLMFLPRFGFAWRAFGKMGTVVRGAYGRYLYPVPIYFSLVSPSQFAPFAADYTQSYTAANQSPDGLPNYLLRSKQSVTAGTNSANVVDSSSTNALLPGINPVFMDTNDAPDQVTQANFTLEQPMKGNSALRISWNFSHDANLWNYYYFNNHPSEYVWEMQTGTVSPRGGASTIGTNQYAATATGPYDKIAWGSSLREDQKTGWTTDNALQFNYQRLYHRGIAWQISYTWSKAMRTGGQWGADGYVYPTADYLYSSVSTMTSPYGSVIEPALPPAQPAGTAPYAYFKDLNKFENYVRDIYVPAHDVKFNGIVDLPFGNSKKFMSNVNRFTNEIVGGWQIAGAGRVYSQAFQLNAGMWGSTSPLHVYKHKIPINDCSSGVCYKEYEWFNGYVAPTANANTGCTKNCISGLPSSVVPYQTPIDTTPGDKYYGQNEVSITLPGGKPTDIAYNPGPDVNPFSKTVLNGPFNWTADASLFKVFSVTEQVNMRFNMDAFNVFNVQGETNPNTTSGIQSFHSSANAARQLQFTLRLTF